jgi:putative membrane protein
MRASRATGRGEDPYVYSTQDYLATLPSFLLYFVAALILSGLFLLIYLFVTPHRELSLIRQGNTAAAASLSGALIGFVLPLASVIQSSLSIIDMLVWGGVALVVQVLVFVVLRLCFPELVRQIEEDHLGPALMLAGFSVAVGILNAACMTY